MAETFDQEHLNYFLKTLKEKTTGKSDSKKKVSDDQRLQTQYKQMEELIELEKKFQKQLANHCWGKSVYRNFIKYIVDIEGNVLISRPYFRERQRICSGDISAAFKKRDIKALQKFHVNNHFVGFAVKNKPWPKNGKIMKIARLIKKKRDEILEYNMPLAISQAKIFWAKGPKRAAVTHLQYMDVIQTACDGLMSAIDKYELPDRNKFKTETAFMAEFRRFRPMMVQRIVGQLIESYSETMIHFFPKDKRKLYRANKFLARNPNSSSEAVAAATNVDGKGNTVDKNNTTHASEIYHLVLAGSALQPDLNPGSEDPRDHTSGFEQLPDMMHFQPDEVVERQQLYSKLHDAFDSDLSIFEKKLLALKGIHL